MPSEVTPSLDIRKFTIKTAPARMQQLKDDPLWRLLDQEPDLMGALARLQGRLGE
jgi:hypothetical protein